MNTDQLHFFRDELEKRAFGFAARTQDLTPTALAGLKRMGVKNPDGLHVAELSAQMNVDESTLWKGGIPSYTSSKKTAGVELLLQGYSQDPTVTPEIQKQLDDRADARSAMITEKWPARKAFEKTVARKGLLNRLMGRTDTTFDSKKYEAAKARWGVQARAADKARPGPEDSWEYQRALMEGPKDTTAGKLTSYVLGDSVGGTGLDTDEAYGDARSSYLNDKQLDKVVGLYEREMSKWDRPGEGEAHQRFLSRAAALKKDPKGKGYRLEWG